MSPKSELKLMDGSTGYVLLGNGMPEDDLFRKIWSARALVEEKYHSVVKYTHLSYLRLGASYITTNSYACQPTYYMDAYGEDGDFEQKMLRDAELAARLGVESMEEYRKERLSNTNSNLKLESESETYLCACLPPLIESHRPDLFVKALEEKGENFFVNHYCNLAKALMRGSVIRNKSESESEKSESRLGMSLFLLETMNNFDEALFGLKGIRKAVDEVMNSSNNSDNGGTGPGKESSTTNPDSEVKSILINLAKNNTSIEVAVSFEGAFRHYKTLQPQVTPVNYQNIPAQYLYKTIEWFKNDNSTHSRSKTNDSSDSATVTTVSLHLNFLGLNCGPAEDIAQAIHLINTDTTDPISKTVRDEIIKGKIPIAAYANLRERKQYDEGFTTAECQKKSQTQNQESAQSKNQESTEESESSSVTVPAMLDELNEASTTCQSQSTINNSATNSDSANFKFKGYVGQQGYLKFAQDVTCCSEIIIGNKSDSDSGLITVQLIGGCCGCGPSGIKNLSDNLVYC